MLGFVLLFVIIWISKKLRSDICAIILLGDSMEEVKNVLNDMNIEYEIIYHPAVFTTEEADKYIEGMEGVPTKTMFMAGKKDKTFYLLILDDSKRLDIKKISEIIGERLHFGKEEHLKEKMGLVPGMVSLFGLINNKDHDIKIYIDKEILNENKITFHPNDNTATMFISIDDMFKFIENLHYNYEIIDM